MGEKLRSRANQYSQTARPKATCPTDQAANVDYRGSPPIAPRGYQAWATSRILRTPRWLHPVRRRASVIRFSKATLKRALTIGPRAKSGDENRAKPARRARFIRSA